jgi:lysophospholipase L1-like esterase
VSQPAAGQALSGFRNTTIRQRVHVSLGGPWVRLRLTNVFGSGPVKVGPVTVARAGAKAGTTIAGTLKAVTFSAQPTVTMAPGAEVVSDPVRLDVPSDSDLLLSLYLPGPTGPATYHAAARATGWTASGNHTADATSDGFAGRTSSYWFLDGVDVQSDARGSVAFVGDSITDGGGSTQDADHRWPDYLADRVLTRPASLQFGVLNAGISGNRVLLDAVNPGQGPSILHRLDRDALEQQAVRTVVLVAGVNDIQQAPVEQDPAKIIAGYEQVAARARAAGLRVVGATIAPFEGWSQWTPQREGVRQEVNDWVRTSGVFDGYLDFDAVLRDPSRPQRLRADLDSGDHLHPRDSGYAAMAASVDLATLLP